MLSIDISNLPQIIEKVNPMDLTDFINIVAKIAFVAVVGMGLKLLWAWLSHAFSPPKEKCCKHK